MKASHVEMFTAQKTQYKLTVCCVSRVIRLYKITLKVHNVMHMYIIYRHRVQIITNFIIFILVILFIIRTRH